MTRYLVVPQWQGSPSSRAMPLIDGALAIAGDLPRSATTIQDVPMEAGESLGTGILRYGVYGTLGASIATCAGVAPDLSSARRASTSVSSPMSSSELNCASRLDAASSCLP